MSKTALNHYLRMLSTSPRWTQLLGGHRMLNYRRERWKLVASPSVVSKRSFISTVISPGGNYEEQAANSVYKTAAVTSSSKVVDHQLKRNVEFFKENGLNTELLFKNTWLLALPTAIIAPKVYYLNKIGINSFTIGLLKFQLLKLMKIVHRYTVETTALDRRIAYLSDVLNCSVADVANIVDKHTFLLTMDGQKLVRVVATFHENGIQGQEIRNNVIVFRADEDVMMERITRAKNIGLTPIRAWMFRCSQEVFDKKLSRFCDAKHVLGKHGDCATYLAHRLRCQRQYVDYLLRRNPKLLLIHPPKLKQMLDFLYEIGFTHTHICQFPVVLSHKLETLQNRHRELRELGYIPKNLQVLCSPNKTYGRLVSKLQEG